MSDISNRFWIDYSQMVPKIHDTNIFNRTVILQSCGFWVFIFVISFETDGLDLCIRTHKPHLSVGFTDFRLMKRRDYCYDRKAKKRNKIQCM